MKLKEGMYVRTKNLGGSIEKIIEIIPKEKTPDLKTRYITDVSREHGLKITDDYIIGEPSYNPIDLIEVGDYVNGIPVFIDEEGYLCQTCVNADDEIYYETLKAKNIKSIVTKEQFNSVKYEVK